MLERVRELFRIRRESGLQAKVQDTAVADKFEPPHANTTITVQPVEPKTQADNWGLRHWNLQQAESEKTNHLIQQMAQKISPIEMRELILDLNIDVPSPSTTMIVSLHLVQYMKRRGRIPELLHTLTSRYPLIDWHATEIIQVMEELAQFKRLSRESRSTPNKEKVASHDMRYWSEILSDLFNYSELNFLAICLGTHIDQLEGNTLSSKITSFLRWVDEKQKWEILASKVVELRPNVRQELQGATAVPPLSPIEQRKQFRQMLESLNLRKLQALCQQFGVDYEDLPGASKSDKARELLVLLERQNRLLDLETLLTTMQAEDSKTAVYHTHHIRTLIFQVFPDDVSLTDFCRQHLPQAVYEFGSGMSYRQKVQELLEYCSHKMQFTPLLRALEATFPEAYTAIGPYIAESAEQLRPLPEPIKAKILLTDEWIDSAKREGRE
jgi:hypothetical protein